MQISDHCKLKCYCTRIVFELCRCMPSTWVTRWGPDLLPPRAGLLTPRHQEHLHRHRHGRPRPGHLRHRPVRGHATLTLLHRWPLQSGRPKYQVKQNRFIPLSKSCSCPSLTRSVPRLASMHPRHYLILVTVTSRFNNIISSIIKYVLSRISVSSTTAPPWSRILALLLEISVSLCHYHAHNQTCMNCMRCTIRMDSTLWEVG